MQEQDGKMYWSKGGDKNKSRVKNTLGFIYFVTNPIDVKMEMASNRN